MDCRRMLGVDKLEQGAHSMLQFRWERSMTDLSITPDDLAVCRRSAQRLREQDREAEVARRAETWRLACVAAGLLRERFDATRVVVFGSLADQERSFTRWSDVDIAAWGISPADTFRALGAVMDISDAPLVNLVDVNTCTASLLETIERDGIDV